MTAYFRRFFAAFAVFGLLIVASPTRAQLLYTLDQPVQSASPNSVVYFGAALQNTDAANPLALNSGNLNVQGTGTLASYQQFTVNNYFADNVPATLAPLGTPPGSNGDRYSGLLFSINTPLAAQVGDTIFGDYTVSFTPTGGTEQFVTQGFTINVVPAPPGLTVFVLGLAVRGACALRRRRCVTA